jgi:hypothetical protein
MKVIDILCDKKLHMAGVFESGKSGMRRIRLCGAEPMPACEASGPVSFSYAAAADEVFVLYRLCVLPVSILVAIVGNARGGAATGATQYSDVLVPMQELDEPVDVTHTRKSTRNAAGKNLMTHKSPLKALAASIVVYLIVTNANGEVLDAAPGGFTISHKTEISAGRIDVYNAAVNNIGDWWSDDHTLSGNAGNMYIEATTHGCFCEKLGEAGGVVHLTVTFVNPGVILRLSGGLGPLGLMGVYGNMTWEFEDGENGTIVTLNYAVGGYLAGGLDSIAEAVNGVLVEQMTSLKTFVEDGNGEG